MQAVTGPVTHRHWARAAAAFVAMAIGALGIPAVSAANEQASGHATDKAGVFGNPLLGHWRFDRMRTLGDDVDQTKLKRVKRGLVLFRTLEFHFEPETLTMTRRNGESVSYEVDYRIDKSKRTVTMIQYRKNKKVKRAFGFDADKPDQMYVARRIPQVGKVRMI